MATNYSFAEAVKIIAENNNPEAIAEIGRKYPALLRDVTEIIALAGDKFVAFAGKLPEHITANKVNAALKGSATTKADDEGDEGTDEEETTETTGDDDYESMNGSALLNLIKERGLRSKLPKAFKKADMIRVLKENDGADGDDETEEADEEETGSENPYEGKGAVELFKECKKRGIKAAPKKPAKFYADLLTKADEAAADEDEGDDDDWGDEEEADEKPAAKPAKGSKPAKPAKGGKPAKPAKPAKAEEEDDEDEDWDI